MKKIVICMLLLSCFLLVLVGCEKPHEHAYRENVVAPTCTDVSSSKSNGKNEVDAYVATKSETDYSVENWTMLGNVAANGKEAINSAATQQEIKRIICETKLKIDGIAPQNTQQISDGVYVLSDDSWELYVRNCVRYSDEDEAWIENTIKNETGVLNEQLCNVGFWPKSFFSAVVVDNQITISNQRSIPYAISEKGNNVYNGIIGQDSIEFFFLNDQLYVRSFNGFTWHFIRDSSYNLDEDNLVKIKCAAPKDIKVTVTEDVISFYWDYLSEYGRFGAVMEVEQANGTVDAHHLDVYMNNFATNVQLSELSEGENIVRIYHCGGPSTRSDEKMALFEQSDYVTFVITVGDEVTVKQIGPQN